MEAFCAATRACGARFGIQQFVRVASSRLGRDTSDDTLCVCKCKATHQKASSASSIRVFHRHHQLCVGGHFTGLSPSPPIPSIRSTYRSTGHIERLSPSPPSASAGSVCLSHHHQLAPGGPLPPGRHVNRLTLGCLPPPLAAFSNKQAVAHHAYPCHDRDGRALEAQPPPTR